MKAWVYIVRCSDGSYYVGSTTDLEQRIADHNTGRFEGYTSKRLPVELLWHQEFIDIRDASVLERQIKGWSRRKKEALMSGDIDLLKKYARSSYSVNQEISKTSFDSPPSADRSGRL